MADDREPAQPAAGDGGPGPCAPCRGTGRLISAAGAEPHAVRCPWCEGTGVRIPGHDAQASGAPAERI